MDDIGHNDLGFVNPAISTPFIDSLATEHGLQLTHFYTAKECAPTRGVSAPPAAAFFTMLSVHAFSQHVMFDGVLRSWCPGTDDGSHALSLRVLPQSVRRGWRAARIQIASAGACCVSGKVHFACSWQGTHVCAYARAEAICCVAMNGSRPTDRLRPDLTVAPGFQDEESHCNIQRI
jgi:hypothetical protein